VAVKASEISEHPLLEPLSAIGLDPPAIHRVLRHFPARILREWADITLAARERFRERFFKRSASAYFIDNIQNAHAGNRTAPDWWHDLRREERTQQAAADRRSRQSPPEAASPTLSDEALAQMHQLVADLFRQFTAAGQTLE
jgi:hypothetical protein